MKGLVSKLAEIQQKLKAPKSQYNSFGKYAYRNSEDILEAVKPLLGDLVLTISDEMVEIGGRVYVKSTGVVTDGEASIQATGYARESETKKGMDDSQITGSTSSYARKYMLNGMFLIDDTKDADATNTGGEAPRSPVKKTTSASSSKEKTSGEKSDSSPEKPKKTGNNFRKSVKTASEDEEL